MDDRRCYLYEEIHEKRDSTHECGLSRVGKRHRHTNYARSERVALPAAFVDARRAALSTREDVDSRWSSKDDDSSSE